MLGFMATLVSQARPGGSGLCWDFSLWFELLQAPESQQEISSIIQSHPQFFFQGLLYFHAHRGHWRYCTTVTALFSGFLLLCFSLCQTLFSALPSRTSDVCEAYRHFLSPLPVATSCRHFLSPLSFTFFTFVPLIMLFFFSACLTSDP